MENDLNTNISLNNENEKNKTKRKILLALLYFIFFLIFVIIIIFVSNLFISEPKIVLNGEAIIEVNVFDSYTDEGAKAFIDGYDETDKIKTVGQVDTTKVGKYQITYSIGNYLSRNVRSVSRIIKVLDHTPPTLILNGESEISLYTGNSYTEEGATANDNYDGDITGQIKITNNIDINTTGTYEVVYEVNDSSGNRSAVGRKVIVKQRPVYNTGTNSYPAFTLNEATYIIVSISDQKLWFYLNGGLYLTSNVITGKKGVFDTPTGTFKIYNKATNTHLKGVDQITGIPYDSFVNFWIPFYGGYGLHDASWQSSFGGNLYTYRGSHGCINLPYSTAQTIYYNAPIGTTVRVY